MRSFQTSITRLLSGYFANVLGHKSRDNSVFCYFDLQRQLTKHVVSRAVCLVVFPGMLYLLQFYIMFTVLRKSGPHDDMMSSAFQASLEVAFAL